MATPDTERAQLRRARTHLDEWTSRARDRAYAEFFEGPSPELTDEELRLLDRIDSDLTRRGGGGLWGTDEYGVVTGEVRGEKRPRVVCTYHPEIPYDGFRGEESLDEATREELNDVLWDYCERVAELLEEELDAFLRTADSETE